MLMGIFLINLGLQILPDMLTVINIIMRGTFHISASSCMARQLALCDIQLARESAELCLKQLFNNRHNGSCSPPDQSLQLYALLENWGKVTVLDMWKLQWLTTRRWWTFDDMFRRHTAGLTEKQTEGWMDVRTDQAKKKQNKSTS